MYIIMKNRTERPCVYHIEESYQIAVSEHMQKHRRLEMM